MARSTLIVGAVVALVAICAGSAAAAQIRMGRTVLQTAPNYEFPPLCNCVRDAKKSPWRLTLSGPTTDGGFNKYCFTVVNVGGCDPTFKCCDGTQGVQKVELDVEGVCKESVKKATVNGVDKSFEYNTELDVLRITQLDLSAAEASGTEICLLLKANSTCPTLSQVCGMGGACKYAIFNPDRDCCPVSLVGAAPPPPSPNPPFIPAKTRVPPPAPVRPPSPPATFPFCRCERNPALSKLTTVPGEFTTVGNLTKFCFVVQVKDGLCPLGSPCCEFELSKFELDANPACFSSLVYTTLDGVKRSRQFQYNPYPVIKVNNINKPFSAVDGTEVCLVMRKPCDTTLSICANGVCTVALFNPRGSVPSCCPLSTGL